MLVLFSHFLSSTCRLSSPTLYLTAIHSSSFRVNRHTGRAHTPQFLILRLPYIFFSIESKRAVINARVIMPVSPRLYKLHEGGNWSNLNKSNSVCFIYEIRMPIYMHGKFIWRQELCLIRSLFAYWSIALRL